MSICLFLTTALAVSAVTVHAAPLVVKASKPANETRDVSVTLKKLELAFERAPTAGAGHIILFDLNISADVEMVLATDSTVKIDGNVVTIPVVNTLKPWHWHSVLVEPNAFSPDFQLAKGKWVFETSWPEACRDNCHAADGHGVCEHDNDGHYSCKCTAKYQLPYCREETPFDEHESMSYWTLVGYIFGTLMACICLERLYASCRKVYLRRTGQEGFMRLPVVRGDTEEEVELLPTQPQRVQGVPRSVPEMRVESDESPRPHEAQD